MPTQRPRRDFFPRLPLVAAGGMVAIALVAAIAGRLAGDGNMQPTATMVAERNLRFEDRADGAVLVVNAENNKTIQVMTGQNGFLRGTLRGFARTRHMEGIGETVPFRLSSWSDGRLILFDPATGRHVDIEAFGTLNEAVFGRLLSPSLYTS
jgi:putative photosynthetic complex assembly protein